jgi:hypothetical protein
VAWRAHAGRMTSGAVAAVAAVLFLLDAPRRVAGQCPATDPATASAAAGDAAVAAVRTRMALGRFYDDGADDVATALRRAAEHGASDLLRPARGVYAGIRYAGENDVDRMTPAASVAWATSLARLPWGKEKASRLASANVSVVRTSAPGPDPPGTRELLRSGGDRIVAIDAPRPEFWAEGRSVELVERRGGRVRLRVGPGAATPLLVARTFDPSWRAAVSGTPVRPLPDGPFTLVPLPPAGCDVDLRYRNPRIGAGALLSLAALTLAGGLVVAGGRR